MYLRRYAIAAGMICAVMTMNANAVKLDSLEGFDKIFGRYAPNGDCKRQPQIVVEKKGFTLEIAGQKETASTPEYAASYGGNYYEGISLWFYPYYDEVKDRPLLLTFNANEKKGVLLVETEFNYKGGPKLPVKYQAVVDASPYAVCR